jgi:putative tricarboxylic transport membrane protein
MLLVLNLPMIGLWARVALVPYQILAPLILISALLGTYAVRNSMFDVWVTLLFGLLGFGMRKLDYPSMPLVLTLLLTPMLETSLRQSLAISQGSLSIFVDRPVAASLLVLAVVSVGLSIWSRRRQSKLTQNLGEINEAQD